MKRALVVARRTALGALLLTAALPAAAQNRGVTLFSGPRQTGDRQTFFSDVPDLKDTRFGGNRAASVSVAHGCRVVLYERSGYRGRSVELFADDNDLGNTPLGRHNASSLRMNCRGGGGGGWDGGGGHGGGWDGGGGHGPRRGVTLFRDRRLRGPSQTFDRDVPDLSRTPFGSNRVSSVDVSPGCIATLFSGPNYRGRSTTFREADNDLSNTPVGEDAVSSLRVRCER